MILVYTPIITRRIEYIFKHIFINIIGIKVNFTAKIDEFVVAAIWLFNKKCTRSKMRMLKTAQSSLEAKL